MTSKADIAILLFTRSASRESQAKRWTSNAPVNMQISQQLLVNTIEKLSKAPFSVYHFDETLQNGNTFSERLCHSFAQVFAKGYHYVIAVGNDCADLNPDWKQIADRLRDGKAVLGPDKRGGVYLIGIGREVRFKEVFEKISWHSNRVFAQLSENFKHIHKLVYRNDINNITDIHTCRNLFSQLRDVLAESKIIPFYIGDHAEKRNRFVFRRGPPLIAIA